MYLSRKRLDLDFDVGAHSGNSVFYCSLPFIDSKSKMVQFILHVLTLNTPNLYSESPEAFLEKSHSLSFSGKTPGGLSTFASWNPVAHCMVQHSTLSHRDPTRLRLAFIKTAATELSKESPHIPA